MPRADRADAAENFAVEDNLCMPRADRAAAKIPPVDI